MPERLSRAERSEPERQALRPLAERAATRRPGAFLGAPPRGLDASAVLSLQRTVGNLATTTYLQREGDEASGATSGVSPVHEAINRSGSPVDSSMRSVMEPVLGTSLSGVQVVEDRHSTRSVDASAYTVGDTVVVNPDHVRAGTPQAQRTLAHELTHVKQQREGPVAGTPEAGGIQVSHPSDRFEQEAERTADAVVAGVQRQALALGATGGAQHATAVQRAAASEEQEEEATEQG
jgi:hypothetical protein